MQRSALPCSLRATPSPTSTSEAWTSPSTASPTRSEAGRISIEFTNDTETDEPHEMLLMKRVDGADEPVSELLEMSEEELFGKVTPTAVAYADDAGGSNVALVDLEPGAYIAICMIPTHGDGPPHAINGMVDEFTVA